MIPQRVPIPNYPYHITIDGEVFRNGSDRPLKPVLRRDGYSVTLSKDNRQKIFRLNNLMRDAYFNGTRLPLKHLDGDKLNFSYWNLKPMPRGEISKYERAHGWNAKAVIEKMPDGTENVYASAAECGRVRHIDASTIRKWCNKLGKNTINDNEYRWEDRY